MPDLPDQIQEDHDRQRYLEALYEADGRASKDHPLHGLYTGLLEQRKQKLVELDRALFLANTDEDR